MAYMAQISQEDLPAAAPGELAAEGGGRGAEMWRRGMSVDAGAAVDACYACNRVSTSLLHVLTYLSLLSANSVRM